MSNQTMGADELGPPILGGIRRLAEAVTASLGLQGRSQPSHNAVPRAEPPELSRGIAKAVEAVTAELQSLSQVEAGGALVLTKPVEFARVRLALASASPASELVPDLGRLRGALRRLDHFGELIGASEAMQELYDLIAKGAPTEAPIFLTGETGTGKEVVARTIHGLSRRGGEAFLPLNCGAVSPSLMESELFGHERGSFTGADRTHKGYFERAHRGTLLLDEVTETPPELQVKLLRTLETGTLLRVGGTEPVRVDVRVIASTNRHPQEALRAGKLRADLLFRLNVFPIHVPALRERPEDIDALAGHFLDAFNEQEGTAKRLAPSALDRLRDHHWPGNVRELRNVVQRAFILAEDDLLPASLALAMADVPAPEGGLTIKVGTSIGEAERRLILATLQHFGGDKRKAAEVLGISLKTLYTRVNSYAGGAATDFSETAS